MSGRARNTLIGIAVIVILGLVAWFGLVAEPGPMAFAGGKRLALADYRATDPTGVPANLADAGLVVRGEYLAHAADCMACHTTADGKPYAGGLAIRTPFGTLYSPNITPDRATGIGNFTDTDFLRALREGVMPDGTRLYPAMPYAAYTYMTDADALAIKAYLFSLAPVHVVTPRDTLRFPYDQRWLMVFWQTLYDPDTRFEPRSDHSAQWNRGAYLAEAMGHCGDCHTPRNLLQALDNRDKFSGATAAGWRAYNITADDRSGVGAWSDAALAQYLAIGHAMGHGTASGNMGEAVDRSLSYLAPADIQAIVAYLRTVPAVSSSADRAVRVSLAPASPKEGVSANVDPRGKQVFEEACVGCHSWSGRSLLTSYATLTGARAVNDPTATNVAQIVISGMTRRRGDGTVAMPAFGDAYSDVEVAAVANYVTERFGSVASSVRSQDIRLLRSQTSQ
ncbi:MAG: c-type cytochrome [Gammaproteobacteria bacterium]|nr:c-type cytochrome [Gammaproteobacteria bacterium]